MSELSESYELWAKVMQDAGLSYGPADTLIAQLEFRLMDAEQLANERGEKRDILYKENATLKLDRNLYDKGWDAALERISQLKDENEELREKYIDALRIMELTMKRMAEVAHDTKEDIAHLRKEPPCP